MSANPKLPLLPAPETTIFRIVDRTLRADGSLGRVVKTWRSYEGRPDDRVDPSLAQCPWVRLSTRNGSGEQWSAPSTLSGRIEVVAEIAVEGSCLDDLHNLWGAVKRALYPKVAADRLAFQERLRAAQARTGLVDIAQSAFDPTPGSDGVMFARGVLSIEYRFDTALEACTT